MKLDVNQVYHQYITRVVIFSLFLFKIQLRQPNVYKHLRSNHYLTFFDLFLIHELIRHTICMVHFLFLICLRLI
jgi:hypothetical protein